MAINRGRSHDRNYLQALPSNRLRQKRSCARLAALSLPCGCNLPATKPRGKPAAVKALATLLYAIINMSFCGIARLLKVSDGAAVRLE